MGAILANSLVDIAVTVFWGAALFCAALPLLALLHWLGAKKCPGCGKKTVYNIAPVGTSPEYLCYHCKKEVLVR